MAETAASLDLMRAIPERLGKQAKCSFLLAVLSNDSVTSSERAMAFAGLVDDIESLAAALDPQDLALFRDVLSEAFEASKNDAASWTMSYPDDALCSQELIDGANVRRVVVPPATGATVVVDVARVLRRTGDAMTIASEYTFLSDDQAALEVVEESTGQVLGLVALERGHNRLAQCEIRASSNSGETSVVVRITNQSQSEPVLWYKSTIVRAQTDNREPVGELLRKGVAKKRAAASEPSVFVPVTGEPLTLADVDRLSALRNKFWGERIFVMGNGPSLNRTPLDLLENEFVFGLNRVSLLFDRVSWRPTFFTAFDVRVVPDNKEEFATVDIPYKFFSARYKGMLGERKNHYWHHTKGHYQGFEASFEPNVVYSGFGGGGTIGVIAIELAFFMGFREIYLIGTDVSYSITKTVKQSGRDQFGDGVKLELESTQNDDQNHFDPRYFGKNKKWHNPNVREMKIGFARAAAYIERRGGMLRNATVGGELTEVERVDFTSLF